MSLSDPMSLAKEPRPEVFILGAGFSRAVAEYMPLLKELSQRTLESYRSAGTIPESIRGLMTENIEEALSFLAASKPWLREAEILRHRALFLELTHVIAAVLQEAVVHSIHMMGTEVPSWLSHLLTYWHINRSVVVTLNYDTLIEEAACELEFPRGSKLRPMATHALYPPFFTDAAVRSGTVIFGERAPSFELLKLHGSTNWYYSGVPSSRGEPIYYVPPSGPTEIWKEGALVARATRIDAIRDKYPFIVPPIFDKASLLTHETIQSIWFRAGDALRRTSRVVFMGYSLPRSDLTMKQFLRENIRHDAVVEVVDTAASASTHIQTQLQIDSSRIRLHQDHFCIRSFSEALKHE